ncbi:VgrG-related protein [Streptomyces sp. NPDC091376]|uniref:VgrG-related protein n=1 Tax=Streptomyces sp. NPDC091376 TaxID=3365994 RepID=UPI00381E96CE
MPSPVASLSTVRATIKIGSIRPEPLRPHVEQKIIRTVVDTHLHLPDMFEITFLDDDATVAQEAGLRVGARVEIFGGASSSTMANQLISGEITSVEAVCEAMTIYTVVRGYERAHRLQRVKRTRAYVNQKDSDIARAIAKEARLDIGEIDETRSAHPHVAQIAQTDWDFLRGRARENGFETGVAGGKFFFRKASSAKSLASVLSRPPEITFRDNLLTFLPRVTSATLTPRVEVRTWDGQRATAVVGRAATASGTADLPEDPSSLTGPFFSRNPLAAVASLPKPGASPEPAGDAHVVVDRPVGSGAGITIAAEELAGGVAEQVASTFAEAEGYAYGDPDIQAGRPVLVAGVPEDFCGTWMVTNARHVFCEDEGGYRTRFYVSGRQDRSLLGLASHGGAAAEEGGRIRGTMCGIVTNVADPVHQGRVKVMLPLLSPTYESDWARVVQFGAGKNSGALFLPEVGDEVLVAFEWGDARRPYVLGGLLNNDSGYSLGGPPVKIAGAAGSVVRRGLVSTSGNKLAFLDEAAPGGAPAGQSSIVLGTAQEDLALSIDEKAGQILLTCKPRPKGGGASGGNGSVTISTAGGVINIDSGAGGTVNVTGGDVSVHGSRQLDLRSDGPLNITGQKVKITGMPIELN